MKSADIVIIGGGVLGGAVAFYLAKQAAGRVIVLERNAAAQALPCLVELGASFLN